MIDKQMSKLSQTAIIVQTAMYILLVIALTNFNSFYHSLDHEDGFVELTGAFSLLVASFILFRSAFVRKTKVKKDIKFWTLIVAGLAFFWASGEEISWGQHMFGTVTPEWLAEVNGQNETNLHNINKKFFDRWLERLTALLAIISAVAHFRGKDRFLSFKLPEYGLAMAFILIPIYRKLQSIYGHDIWPVGFLFFFVYPYLAYKLKNLKLFIYCLLFVFTTALVVYIHHNNLALFNGKSNILHEVKEMMFSLMCVFYALTLLKDEKQGALASLSEN